MVTRTLNRHKKHLEEKFTDAEFSHLEDVLHSQKKVLQFSGNLLFVSILFVVFVLTVVTSLVMLPLKIVLPEILFYGSYATSAFVLGIFVVYFIYINPEFERHHHILLFILLMLFNFVAVFLSYFALLFISEGVVFGTMLSYWKVGFVASIGLLIPYALYWVLLE